MSSYARGDFDKNSDMNVMILTSLAENEIKPVESEDSIKVAQMSFILLGKKKQRTKLRRCCECAEYLRDTNKLVGK